MNSFFTSQVSSAKPIFAYLKKQRENEKFMHYLEIAATFSLITFFLFFAIKPTVLTIASLVGDIKSKQLLKKELKTKINDVIRAQDLFSQAQERYSVINSSLPSQANYSQAADQIQQTAAASGLSADSFTYSLSSDREKSINQNADYFSVALNLKGPFGSTVKLVTDLLNNRRLINIASFNISNGRDVVSLSSPSASPNQLGTRFNATFYYWPD